MPRPVNYAVAQGTLPSAAAAQSEVDRLVATSNPEAATGGLVFAAPASHYALAVGFGFAPERRESDGKPAQMRWARSDWPHSVMARMHVEQRAALRLVPQWGPGFWVTAPDLDAGFALHAGIG